MYEIVFSTQQQLSAHNLGYTLNITSPNRFILGIIHTEAGHWVTYKIMFLKMWAIPILKWAVGFLPSIIK